MTPNNSFTSFNSPQIPPNALAMAHAALISSAILSVATDPFLSTIPPVALLIFTALDFSTALLASVFIFFAFFFGASIPQGFFSPLQR